jgi:hypothetical protein
MLLYTVVAALVLAAALVALRLLVRRAAAAAVLAAVVLAVVVAAVVMFGTGVLLRRRALVGSVFVGLIVRPANMLERNSFVSVALVAPVSTAAAALL